MSIRAGQSCQTTYNTTVELLHVAAATCGCGGVALTLKVQAWLLLEEGSCSGTGVQAIGKYVDTCQA